VICGGAWLDPSVELLFRAAGLQVLQGYGMTETAPVITLNPYDAARVGTVGRPLDGVEVRLTEQGEVMTRGPHVMLGYYKDPEATARAIQDGWLLTGDLGRLDERGYLTITGRCKELLVLSNGKNVPCALLEQALRRSRYILEVFVVGDRRKYVSALIIPHRENLARWAREGGIVAQPEAHLLLDPAVVSLFRKELARTQAEFSTFEQVKRFCFLDEAALLDKELVTPTQKIRRSVLERKYEASIRQMYAQEEPLVIPASGLDEAAPPPASASPLLAGPPL
jgi:long-chain acyl-CoA synthetase